MNKITTLLTTALSATVVVPRAELEQMVKDYKLDATLKMQEGSSRQAWQSEGIADFIERHLLKSK